MAEENELPRALPGAVFVPEETLRMIAEKIAKLSDQERKSQKVILVRSGRYRASTDQVVLYEHFSRMAPPKAELIQVAVSRVKDVPLEQRVLMGASEENDLFLEFLNKYWDKDLVLDSWMTLMTCYNLRGGLIDRFVETFRFHSTLLSSDQE